MLKLMCTVDAKLRGQRSRACLRKWCSPRSRTALMYCYNNNTLASVSFSASLSCHSHFNTFFSLFVRQRLQIHQFTHTPTEKLQRSNTLVKICFFFKGTEKWISHICFFHLLAQNSLMSICAS